MSQPPLPVLLAYRFFGWRVGPDHRAWVHADITGRGWLIRQGAPALSVLLLVGAIATAVVGGDSGRLLALITVLAGAGAFLRNSLRDRALRQQGLEASGDVLATATWYADADARRRRNLQGAIGTTVIVVVALFLVAYRSRR